MADTLSCPNCRSEIGVQALAAVNPSVNPFWSRDLGSLILAEYRRRLHDEINRGAWSCGCRLTEAQGFAYCRTDGRALSRLGEMLCVG